MTHDACTLTTKDLTILEVMLERCLDEPMRELLRRKIRSATVVFHDDVPPDAATIGSRVCFRVDDGSQDSRVLSHEKMSAPLGLYLPITTRRGLALLGLRQGQEFVLTSQSGRAERVVLDTVLYQPEAARRMKQAEALLSTPDARRAALRVIAGSSSPSPRPMPYTGPDDPGPSAA